MLRINRLAIFATGGRDIIMDHDYDSVYDPDVVSAFVQKLTEPEEMDDHTSIKKDWQACSLRVNNVWFAVFCNTTCISPADVLYMVTFLRRFSELCKEVCGSVDSLTLERNLLLIMEIVGCILVDGYVQLMDPAKVKTYLTIEPLSLPGHISFQRKGTSLANPVESFSKLGLDVSHHSTVPEVTILEADHSSKASSSQRLQSRASELFVDVIEKVTASLNVQGVPSSVFIEGEIKAKSLAIGQTRLHVVFDQLPSGFESVMFGRSVVSNDVPAFIRTGAVSACLDSPMESSATVMTYQLNRLCAAPFVVQAVAEAVGQSLNISLKLENRLPSNVTCFNTCVCYQIPDGHVIHKHNADVKVVAGLLTWSIDELRGGAPCETRYEVTREQAESKQSDNAVAVDCAKVTFEIANHLSSGMKLRTVKVDTATSSGTKKWIRTVTVSRAYDQKLSA